MHTSSLNGSTSEEMMSDSCRLIHGKPAAYQIKSPRCSTNIPTVARPRESLLHTITITILHIRTTTHTHSPTPDSTVVDRVQQMFLPLRYLLCQHYLLTEEFEGFLREAQHTEKHKRQWGKRKDCRDHLALQRPSWAHHKCVQRRVFNSVAAVTI